MKNITLRGLKSLAFLVINSAIRIRGTDEEISHFCQSNYGVTFQVYSKIDVKGDQAHPLFEYLTEEAGGMLSKQIKWKFTKFLIDKDGNVINCYASQTKPEDIEKDIEKALVS
jgi:glutathione peroxidase